MYTTKTYLQDAKDYLRGCKLIKKKSPRLAKIQYSLIGHSLECALKAALLKKGVSFNCLKNRIGHNLNKALTMCEEKGLNIFTKQDEKNIKGLNIYYKKYEFRYSKNGTHTLELPDLKDIQDIINKIIKEICKK